MDDAAVGGNSSSGASSAGAGRRGLARAEAEADDGDDDAPWVSAKWFPVAKPLNASRAAVIVGDWKLLQNSESQPAYRPSENETTCDCSGGSWPRYGARYIFNLADDPQESNDLYDELVGGEIEIALQAVLEQHYRAALEHDCAWRPATKSQAFGLWDRSVHR